MKFSIDNIIKSEDGSRVHGPVQIQYLLAAMTIMSKIANRLALGIVGYYVELVQVRFVDYADDFGVRFTVVSVQPQLGNLKIQLPTLERSYELSCLTNGDKDGPIDEQVVAMIQKGLHEAGTILRLEGRRLASAA